MATNSNSDLDDSYGDFDASEYLDNNNEELSNLAHDYDLNDDEASVLAELMADYDLDAETAMRVTDLMEEYDLDEEDAIAMDEEI